MQFIDGAAMIVGLFGFEGSISQARITFVRRLSQIPPVPTAKLSMEYLCIPRPRLNSLVFVLVNGIDIREQG